MKYENIQTIGSDTVESLRSDSMLAKAEFLCAEFQGSSKQWRSAHYGFCQFESLLKGHSVWLDCYFRSVVTDGCAQSALQAYSSPRLWSLLHSLGITALHTNPMRVAGGAVVEGKEWHYTPSTDGGYDRVAYGVDREFGAEDEYRCMVGEAGKHGIAIAGDIVPGHTGTGPDFLLALVKFGQYPSLFHMVEIPEGDWGVLPASEGGPLHPDRFTNLSAEQVDELAHKGYIIGRLNGCIFYTKGVKETNWSCSGPVRGVDGIVRRWVYLHLFKQGQPTLNWLDPLFTAQRLLTGDIIYSRQDLGAKILRLDANMLLGVERGADGKPGFAAGHPLTNTITEMLTMMMHKMGGWTYQENSLVLDKLATFQKCGSDMSYDFIYRSGIVHAAVSGNASLLKFQVQELYESDVSAKRLIHSLQNHDEMYASYQSFNENPTKVFSYDGKLVSGKELSEHLVKQCEHYSSLYSIPYTSDYGGFMTTFATIALARLGISRKGRDFNDFTNAEKEAVVKALKPLIVFSAIQPGIFQISAWDLMGCIQLEPEEVKEMTKDGDFRWCNRPGYKIIGDNSTQQGSRFSVGQLPRGRSVFGPLDVQEKFPSSLFYELRNILHVRKELDIALCCNQIPLRTVSKGCVCLMHVLSASSGEPELEMTIVNFSEEPCSEMINLSSYVGTSYENRRGKEAVLEEGLWKSKKVINMLPESSSTASVDDHGCMTIEVTGYGCQIVRLV